MKKTTLIGAAIALLLSSCGGNYKAAAVKMVNENDSLNYAFGLANGNTIKQYYLADDSSEITVVEFIKAVEKAYETTSDADDNIGEVGREIGFALKQMSQTGLVGMPSLPYDGKLVMQGMVNGLNGYEEGFAIVDARGYLQQGLMEMRTMQGDTVEFDHNQTIEVPEINAVELKNRIDSLNYAFGLTNGSSLKQYYLAADSVGKQTKLFLKAVKAGYADKAVLTPQLAALAKEVGASLRTQDVQGLMGDTTLILSFDLIRQGLLNGLLQSEIQMSGAEAGMYLQSTMEARMARANEAKYGSNREAGEKFLAENATKEGIVITDSGLQYEVIKQGKGKKPTLGDKVKVHYHGTLIDGKVFDSSVERGEPITFGVTQVIPGWTEALQLMPVGSKWKLYIPFNLAYGDRAAGDIPPYSALIFEVELLDIEK